MGEHLLKLALQENQIIDYEICYTLYRKPFLINSKHFKFNISHSGDWVVCVCDNVEIGIDLERVHSIDYIAIAKRFFSKEEYNFLIKCDSHNEMLKNFYLLWTLKESYIKMIGHGLSIGLNSFSVVENHSIKKRIKSKHTGRMSCLSSIELLKDYKFSICSEKKKAEYKYKFISLKQLIY